jgi:hypothetical protein
VANKEVYKRIYDDAYFLLWEMNLGQPHEGRTAYKGARLYGQFLMSEINRYVTLANSDEAAIERRGLVSPMDTMRGWAFNVLEDCRYHRIPPPTELCDAIHFLMGCTNYLPPRGKPEKRQSFIQLMSEFPNLGESECEISGREAARRIGVDKRTIERWIKEWPFEDEGNDPERWGAKRAEIYDLTRVNSFLLPKYRPGHT